MAKYQEWTTEEGLTRLEGWARDGLTDDQISHNMGVSRSTLNEWKNRFPALSDALKKGKEVADILVENALFKRACGYKTVEVKRVQRGSEGMEVVSETEKEVPPDVTAAIFWLKNRRPDAWRDGKHIDAQVFGRTGDFELVIEPTEE